MPEVVVDNSVAVKWYLPEEHADYAAVLLLTEFRLNAPDLIVAEMANVLWRKTLTGGLSHQEAGDIASGLSRQGVQLHALSPLMTHALELSVTANHPAYDCFYLALALHLGGTCVTADRRFYDAFARRYPDTMVWIEDLTSGVEEPART
ncbi:MAG: type II toxin-antitoxin system VapC family toxin [Dehalococcoidia bacterium]